MKLACTKYDFICIVLDVTFISITFQTHQKAKFRGGGANLPPTDGNRVNTPAVALIVPSLSKRLDPPVIIRTRLLS